MPFHDKIIIIIGIIIIMPFHDKIIIGVINGYVKFESYLNILNTELC